MLVVTRKCGESIYVGDSLVTVLRVGDRDVRLGITADRAISVDREEVRNRKLGIITTIPMASRPPEHRKEAPPHDVAG